jgi:ribosome-associated protein
MLNRKETKTKNTPLLHRRPAKTVSPEQVQLNMAIIEAIRDTKGVDIVLLDLTSIPEAGADFFIICTGNSTTHVSGIADKIERQIGELLDIAPAHIEGKEGKSWLLVDYFTTLVHIFSPSNRHIYNLESLWSDAQLTRFGDIA